MLNLIVLFSVIGSILADSHITVQVGPQGLIKHPREWPNGQYTPGTQLRWKIHPTRGQVLKFNFRTPFGVTKNDDGSCTDYIQILDSNYETTPVCSADNKAKALAVICGTNVPDNLTITAPEGVKKIRAVVDFCSSLDSDGSIGFALEWHASCHHHHHSTTARPHRTTTPRPPHRTTTAAPPPSNCGVQAPQYKPVDVDEIARIVGGEHAKPHSWPWAVAMMPQDEGGLVECGGSLINDQWMITAGHCFYDTDEQEWATLRMKLGADNHGSSEKPNEPSQQVMEIDKAIVHPNYDPGKTSHDITLVKFKSKVKFTDEIKPICLPKDSDVLPGGTKTVTIGWGNTVEGGDESTVLNQVVVPIVNFTKCSQDYPDMLDDTMICAGNEQAGGVDSCQGDSGGALMSHNGQVWSLEGIVSWGQGCAEPHEPGVYSRVASLVDWVQQTLHNDGYYSE